MGDGWQRLEKSAVEILHERIAHYSSQALAREAVHLQILGGRSPAESSAIVESPALGTSMATNGSVATNHLVDQRPSPADERASYLDTGNIAPDDYQMRLMMLELQNSKRLLMARQEQEQNRKDQTESRPDKPVPLSTSTIKRMREPPSDAEPRSLDALDALDALDERGGTPVQASPIGSPATKRRMRSLCLGGETQSGPSLPPSSTTAAAFSPSEVIPSHRPGDQRNLRSPSLQAPGQSEISRHHAISSSSPESTRAPNKSDGYRTLHQILCNSSRHAGESKIFSQKPSWSDQDAGHDEGVHLTAGRDFAVNNLSSFIKDADRIFFLVLHYYRCSDATNVDHICAWSNDLDHQAGAPARRDEGVLIISRSLQRIMNNISSCKSDRAAYWPKPNEPRESQDFSASNNHQVQHKDEYSMPFFYHHRNHLRKALKAAETIEDHDAITSLIIYTEQQWRDQWREMDALTSQGRVKSHNIELLFCPNTMVITRIGGKAAACVLRSWPSGDSIISLDCWAFRFDGNAFIRKPVTLAFNRPTTDDVALQDLGVIPSCLAAQPLLDSLERRGRKFWGLRYQSYVAYEGWDFNGDQYYSNESRWMIDYRTYKQMHPTAKAFESETKENVPFDSWPSAIQHHETPLLDHFMVMPAEVHGFSFKNKTWCSLLVDNIRTVSWNKGAFEKLVLPSRIKDTVESLVMARASSRDPKDKRVLATRRDDWIAGNDYGLVMLLHGGPGTGKTLTAESVAELAEMPLYSVPCGNIGTKPEAVEKHLETVLMLGKRWDCVLLLDEADVFLRERSPADMEGKGLTSVFLRTLESYNGIIILTSGRLGAFDAACTSRIQVSLHYDTPDRPSRRRIWQNFFEMMKADDGDAGVDGLAGHVDHLATIKMNGRQIRSAFTTARQLALFRKEALCWDHMEQALESCQL